MRILSIIALLFSLILSTACTTSGDDITSPIVPSLQNTDDNITDDIYECRANMLTIFGQAVIFYAENGHYPSSLEEIGMAGVVCPTHGNEYILISTESEFYIECGLPQLPNHGNINNGIPSWHNQHADPHDWEDICRANMRTIASQAVIFFASNNHYPNSLKEIGMEGVFCPACGSEYQLIGTETEFFVGCPMPQLPNHGNIENGIPSWHEEP